MVGFPATTGSTAGGRESNHGHAATRRCSVKRALSAFFALLLICGNVQLWAQAADWKDIKIPPLPAFHPPQPKRIVLPNGMVVFLQEDHELPLVDGIARIRGGGRSVPANKTGLMDIYGEVWRTGGTK